MQIAQANGRTVNSRFETLLVRLNDENLAVELAMDAVVNVNAIGASKLPIAGTYQIKQIQKYLPLAGEVLSTPTAASAAYCLATSNLPLAGEEFLHQ